MKSKLGPNILRAILENTTDFVVVCTPEMVPQYVNPAGLSMLGVHQHDNLRANLLDYIWPEDRHIFESIAIPAWKKDGQWHGECRLRNFATEEPVCATWNIFTVRDDDDGAVSCVCVANNRSSLKSVERRLQEKENQFQFLVDSMPQIMWTATPEGEQDFANRRWFEFTGLSANGDSRRPYRAICHPDDVAETERSWEEAVRTGQPYNCVHRVLRHDGQYRWILTQAVPQHDSNGQVIRWFGTGADITEMKLAQEALVRTEKLASVGRLAATVAHEINNPLEAVMNSVYLARYDPSTPPHVEAYLETAEVELQRVAHIARQTLGFYRENAAPSRVEVREITDGVLELFAPRLRNKGIHVERRYSGRIVPVFASPGEIRQVISNLISNSIDALSKDGILKVRISPITLEGEQHVAVTVADNGCGIARENLPHLFEAFFTTKESVGTGLGLWVTHGIVEKHNGRIAVKSREGSGTVFRVYLRAAKD